MMTDNPSEPDRDILFNDAVNYILETRKASATLLQRHFRIGFARTGCLLDELERAGIVGPVSGARPREILINSVDELDLTKPPVMNQVLDNTPKLKWQKTTSIGKGFSVTIGTNEKGIGVRVDLEKYGNLILVGSQMTGISDLTNQIILEQVQHNSPDDLKLLVIDGFINQIDLPAGSPHLLLPKVRAWDKVESTIKWLRSEIEYRLQNQNSQSQPKILLVINGYNEIIGFSDAEYFLERILTQGKSVNVYTVITFDYLASNLSKGILANNGAKVIFKPTTRQMARSSGIPESINLESPNEAILETMFEGKTKLKINKMDVKKIYQEIFK